MSGHPYRVADGIMDCSIINDNYNVYTFNAPQPLTFKAGHKYVLLLEGVSKVSVPNWEDIMFNGELLKFQHPDSSDPNPQAPYFAVKFEQASDATGQFNGRLNYNTKQHNDTPRLTWILQTWPMPDNSGSSGAATNGSSSTTTSSVLLSATQADRVPNANTGSSLAVYEFGGEVSLKAGDVYTLTVSPVTAAYYWENIFFGDMNSSYQQVTELKRISQTPDMVLQITPKTTAKGRFSARLETTTHQNATLSFKLEGVSADITDTKSTVATSGSMTPKVAKGYATINLDATWFNIQTGTYALAVTGLNPGPNTFWEFLQGPGGQITPAQVNIQGIDGFTVKFVVRLDGPPAGGLRGAMQYGSTDVPSYVTWTLYKLDA